MRRLVGAVVLLPVLVLGAGCRGGDVPAQPGVEDHVSDVESTLDAVESELAGG